MSALILGTWCCAPLTFSNDAAIDFTRYATISVSLGGPDGAERHAQYLAAELGAHSGFSTVTANANQTVDATLQVNLALDIDESFFGDDPDTYSAQADYSLVTADGALIDGGSESVSDSSSAFDAAEDVLDEIVSHYLPAYRL